MFINYKKYHNGTFFNNYYIDMCNMFIFYNSKYVIKT